MALEVTAVARRGVKRAVERMGSRPSATAASATASATTYAYADAYAAYAYDAHAAASAAAYAAADASKAKFWREISSKIWDSSFACLSEACELREEKPAKTTLGKD